MPQINPTSGQVSDSSQGIPLKEVNSLIGAKEDGQGQSLSGAENSIIEDSHYPDAILSDEAKPGTSLSDAEAGYDQAAYDEEVDSAGDEPTPTPSRGPASVLDAIIPSAGAADEVPSKGALQLKALRDEGVSESDILEWRQVREQALRDEKVPDEEIREYFGDPEPDTKKLEASAKAMTESWHAPMVPEGTEGKYNPLAKDTEDSIDAFVAGIQGSALGLAYRGKLPDKDLVPREGKIGWLDSIMHGAGQLVGDSLHMIAGEAMGTAAGAQAAIPAAAVSGPAAPYVATGIAVGTGLFGAGLVPGIARKTMIDGIRDGSITDQTSMRENLIKSIAKVNLDAIVAGAKEGAINVATGGAGALGGKALTPLAKSLAKNPALSEGIQIAAAKATKKAGALTGEIVGMGTGQAALEHRMPTANDYAHAAPIVLGLNAVMGGVGKATGAGKEVVNVEAKRLYQEHVSKKLQNITLKTGLLPDQVLSMAEQNPTLHRELIVPGDHVPHSLDNFLQGRPRESSTSDYVQIDMNLPEQGELGISGRSSKEQAFKEPVSATINLPEMLGGDPYQIELNIPEQGDLGLTGQKSETSGKQEAGYDGTIGDKQGRMYLVEKNVAEHNWFSGDKRIEGEQHTLGIDYKALDPVGTQFELPMSDGTLGEAFVPLEMAQGELGIKADTYGSSKEKPGTQYAMGVEGQDQQTIGLTGGRAGKESPKFNPTESAATGKLDVDWNTISPKVAYESVSDAQIKAMSNEVSAKLIDKQIGIIRQESAWSGVSMRELNRQLIEEFSPLKRVVRMATNTKTEKELRAVLKASEDPNLLAHNNRGIVGKVISAIEHGTFSYKDFKKTGESAVAITGKYSDNSEASKGFWRFVHAARALEVGLRDKRTPFDPVAVKKEFESGKEKYGRDAKRLAKWHHRLLDYLVEAGVKSREEADAMVATGEFYAPMKRIFDGNDLHLAVGKLNPKDPTNKMVGSDKMVVHAAYSMIAQVHDFIAMAERNRVARSMKNLLQDFPEVMKKMGEADGGTVVDLADGSQAVEFRPLKPNEMAVFENGKREVYEVPADVAQAMKGMTVGEADLLAKIITEPMKWHAALLRAGATLVPDFLVRNVMRDQLHAFVTSEGGYIPYIDYVSGLMSYTKKTESYQKWLLGGGMNAVRSSLSPDYVDGKIAKLARETGFLNSAYNTIKHPFQMLGHVAREGAEFAESGTRLGEFNRVYKKAIKAGSSDMDATLLAANAARKVTVDFQAKGASRLALTYNAITPFFNAQNQGIAQAVNMAKERPAELILRGGLIALGAIANWARNYGDPRVASLKEGEKKSFFHFTYNDWQPAIPEEEGLPMSRKKFDGTWEYNRGGVFKMPMPQEFGLVFSYLPVKALDLWSEYDPEGAKKIAHQIFETLAPGLPQTLKLGAEVATNKSFFRDNSIVDQDLVDNLSPHNRFSNLTSETAKLISEKLSNFGIESDVTAPLMIDYAVQNTAATAGGWSLAAADYILDKLIAKDPGAKKRLAAVKDWKQEPFAKSFFVQYEVSNQDSDDFYKGLAADRRSLGDASKYKKNGDSSGYVRETAKESFAIADAMKPVMSATKAFLKDSREAVTKIQAISEKELPKSDKLRLVHTILAKRAQVLEETMAKRNRVIRAVRNGQDPYLAAGLNEIPPQEEDSNE